MQEFKSFVSFFNSCKKINEKLLKFSIAYKNLFSIIKENKLFKNVILKRNKENRNWIDKNDPFPHCVYRKFIKVS